MDAIASCIKRVRGPVMVRQHSSRTVLNNMFSLIAIATLAVTVSAANFKRVACPDGVNTATNGEYNRLYDCEAI